MKRHGFKLTRILLFVVLSLLLSLQVTKCYAIDAGFLFDISVTVDEMSGVLDDMAIVQGETASTIDEMSGLLTEISTNVTSINTTTEESKAEEEANWGKWIWFLGKLTVSAAALGDIITTAVELGIASKEDADSSTDKTQTDSSEQPSTLAVQAQAYQQGINTKVQKGNYNPQLDKNKQQYSNLNITSLIGNSNVHSKTQQVAAANFVSNASAANYGVAAPQKVDNPTPEMLEHSAMYQTVASHRSAGTHVLSLLGASRKDDGSDKTPKSATQMSDDIITFAKCKDKTGVLWLICAVANVPALLPAVIYMGKPLFEHLPALTGVITTSMSLAMQKGFLDPMGQLAGQSAEGSPFNRTKK